VPPEETETAENESGDDKFAATDPSEFVFLPPEESEEGAGEGDIDEDGIVEEE
jgi:hypothetical protein